MLVASKVHSHISAKNVRPLENFDVTGYRDLGLLGITLDTATIREMTRGYSSAMDSLQPLVTQGSVNTPVQFLQNWLPGLVFVITAARKIDDLIGLQITGAWEDEMIVQGLLERTGTSLPYQDWTNVPLSSWNADYVTRTVIRFEEGMKVGNLEAARAARQLVDDAGMKRESCALALEIQRNTIGFYGFNNGLNNTYGFLNDPGLLAYTIVANGVLGSPLWRLKTFLEIQRDI